jgi:hypothetical protein
MKTRLLIISGVIGIIAISLLVSDQYYLSLQDREIKNSDWVKNCVPPKDHQVVPSIGLYNHTHSFDLLTCTWHPTEHGTPGFLESLYTSFIEPIFFDIADVLEIKYAYAGCAATFPPQPCFDSFRISHEPMTQKSIMESFARNIEVDHPDWQMSDRKWNSFEEKMSLPAIICTEFVAYGGTHYRMAEWIDESKISSFENHRNDWMCNKWFPPVDDGITIKWDKSHYLPDGVGTVQIIDKSMNLDDSVIDSIEMHVHSDVDHTGIQLTITETFEDSGIFEGTVFFTTTEQSSGNTLLVEDAVHASYKENYNFSRIINDPEYGVTGSYEIVDENGEKICLGGRGMILDDQCRRIGNYDPQTGIPIVDKKEECDKLNGTWYDERKLCDSKYAPVEYRFQFGPEPMPNEKFPPGAIVDCISGFHFNGTACVPDNVLEISYGHQWLLKIFLIMTMLIVAIVGIIIGVKVWWNRK